MNQASPCYRTATLTDRIYFTDEVFKDMTSSGALALYIPFVRSGIGCGAPFSLMDCSDRQVMHIHAAAS